ncbi:DUF4124 domain-containing protein [Marinobacter panjinensis]|uniref:DUF4124 domain-containing protein n=1 Tax=Marinobacter panjinensis TaxID=2576384 RepID=A0A4U6R527_9GAMM|nr:DUF4124 domain-containing protein [Marinobacter panjinensis]MCR8914533.1 DUF4124 domain-containing protein [Marinobacter panjinensis]TKV68643.1 DUF4124 domain-containing protein [Marinobacter panjinensis]
MKQTLLIGILMLAVPATTWSQVYRCDAGGETRYSDQPCGKDSERITIRDNRIGGSFGQNLPPEPKPEKTETEQDKREQQQAESTCRFINSTDLRRYLVREQVVKGMTREHVRKAFGRPPETYPTPQETWVYQTKYYGNLYELTYVYFRDGCVEDVVYRKP